MKRRGTTILECTLALAITAVATALFAQLLVAASSQRRIAEQRRIALTEVANALDRATLLDCSEITPERLEQSPLSPAAAELLPGAELAAVVTDEPGPPAGRRIRIELSWTNAAGVRQPPVALARWRYAQEQTP